MLTEFHSAPSSWENYQDSTPKTRGITCGILTNTVYVSEPTFKEIPFAYASATIVALKAATNDKLPDPAFLVFLDHLYELTRDFDLIAAILMIRNFYKNGLVKVNLEERRAWSFFEGSFDKNGQAQLQQDLAAYTSHLIKNLKARTNETPEQGLSILILQRPNPSWQPAILPQSRWTQNQRDELVLEEMRRTQKIAYPLALGAGLLSNLLALCLNLNDVSSLLKLNLIVTSLALLVIANDATLGRGLGLPDKENNLYLAKNRQECANPAIACSLASGLIYSLLVDSSLTANFLAMLSGGALFTSFFSAKKFLCTSSPSRN